MNITNFVFSAYVQKCKWFGLFMSSCWNICYTRLLIVR